MRTPRWSTGFSSFYVSCLLQVMGNDLQQRSYFFVAFCKFDGVLTVKVSISRTFHLKQLVHNKRMYHRIIRKRILTAETYVAFTLDTTRKQ
jgi:hypothetical protein